MNKNKGMLLEEIINNTIEFLAINQIAFIEKKLLPYKFRTIERAHNKLKAYSVQIIGKSTVDYIGINSKGRFICFEAKTCEGDYFYLNQIKEHQFLYLSQINKLNGVAFVILYMSNYNLFFKIPFDALQKAFDNVKSVNISWLKDNSKELTLEFPGYLNFID
ncbi:MULTISPECIES: Holliday junction resolvase RecU [unclassified Mycoplasma]|uniref:Holliday junction resolvase RecU n=1 Tax=unclassified Mycoplasma TaxID=2683645 RepID=UPI00211CBCA0|nr:MULTISPECIES: Holliday junction resolvase RecU [unclassified Mycoplasma]UUM19863.1 Holliday junction resolvase RecU [Mycoplasma sp. 1578d]UUM24847.1 Holliday junction resolvase RecU [Mycoplasma sp. 3686d]